MPSEWGYGSKNGPSSWSEWYPLAKGDRQSPININTDDCRSYFPLQKLVWKYIAENSEEISNTGCGWKIQVNGNNSVLFGGPLEGKYQLEQFHSHWGANDDQGSEHTINGKRFPGELHLVHWNVTKYNSFEEACEHPDGLCVLGIFFKPGKENVELAKVIKQLAKVPFKDQCSKIDPIDPEKFIPQNVKYWTYQGSLTTPPCLECVIWIVFEDPIEVSPEQLKVFRSLKTYCSGEDCPYDEFEGLIKTNFRPTVPLGKRDIRQCKQ